VKEKEKFDASTFSPEHRCLGQDSEFFLWDKEKEKVVESFHFFEKKPLAKRLFGGTQEAAKRYWGSTPVPEDIRVVDRELPEPIPPFDDVAPLVFRDGLAVEINTAPTNCRGWFYNNVRWALWLADAGLPEHVGWTSRPWVEVDPKDIQSWPEDLKELGCSPTLDAYTGKQKILRVNPLKLPFRTSGSHFHMSFYTKPALEGHTAFIKLADMFIGLPFTFLFGDELEFKRRKLYGQAGEYRVQEYKEKNFPNDPPTPGLEYRVLSSRVWSHPGIFSLFSGIWKYVLGQPRMLEKAWDRWDPAWEDELQEAINLGSEAALQSMMQKSVELMPSYYDAWERHPSGTDVYGYPLTPKARFDESDQLLYLRGDSFSPEEKLSVWKKLREHARAGAFPDMGVMDPKLPEAHVGWQHYAQTQKLNPKVVRHDV